MKLKTIADSQTQTEVFSVLEKTNQLIEVTQVSGNLKRLNLSHKVTKNSINSIFGDENKKKVQNIDDDLKKNLNFLIARNFPNNKAISDIKKVFECDKVDVAKRLLRQLQVDYESTTKYDGNGYLGIHRAILNDNVREVQRHLFILKRFKKDIDVPTEDGVVSFECFSNILHFLNSWNL